MLRFTHQTKNSGSRWIEHAHDFEPIIITNKLPKEVSSTKEQKIIGKVTELMKNPRTTSREQPKASKTSLAQQKQH